MPTNRRHSVIAVIREFKHAVPFQPSTIRMVSGECFNVLHPEFVCFSPKGSLVVFVDANDCPHHLSTLLIENVSPRNGHRARKGGKRR
jgi:hypothetical protein